MENWSGNVTFSAMSIVAADSVDHLQAVVAGAAAAGRRVGVVGARHSFSAIADTDGVLLTTERLDAIGDVESTGDGVATITLEAGVRLAELAAHLHERGWALHNLPSLTHLTVVGAIATGTHGSGDANPSLADAVVAVDVVRPDGEIERIDGDHPAFPATVVGLGVMGVVARLVVRLVPTYDIAQTVWLGLPVDTVHERLDDILGLGHSVSLFTEWRHDEFSQVWVKRRPGTTLDRSVLAGTQPADRAMHPIVGFDASACTVQLDRPGPWHERLPHFRPDHRPSAGDELQSECFVARHDAAAASAALRPLAAELAPLVLVSELRSVASDDLWSSMAHGRDSVAFHFTWRPEPVRVLPLLARVEAALDPFEPRPHWGKLTTMSPATIRSRYERIDDMMALRARFDPSGVFLNRYVDDVFGR